MSQAQAIPAARAEARPFRRRFGRLPLHLSLAALVIVWAVPAVALLGTFHDAATYGLPIPPSNDFVGLELRGQALFLEVVTNTLAASPGVELTIL